MAMTRLSYQTLERRARAKLARYGLKVEYHREEDCSWYTVHANENRPHIDWPDDETCYPDVWKLLELTEYLHERYEVE